MPVQAEIGRAVATNFLLAHLNAEQQALAFGRMQACTARQGDTIIAKGQPGDWFYVVASGSYDVLIGDEAVLTYCREDEADAYPSFGELAYISPTSPLHLPYISPTSRLHLVHISPISPQASSRCSTTRRARRPCSARRTACCGRSSARPSGAMQGRCRGDAGEIQGRYRVLWALERKQMGKKVTLP